LEKYIHEGKWNEERFGRRGVIKDCYKGLMNEFSTDVAYCLENAYDLFKGEDD
jgi:hypothetical protein